MNNLIFSEKTNRLRRNLMAFSLLSLTIKAFGITIKGASASGVQVGGLDTQVVLVMIGVMMIYHLLAFLIGAIEEERHWRITFSDKPESRPNGSISTSTIIEKIIRLDGHLSNVENNAKNTGNEAKGQQQKLRDALSKALASVNVYNQHLAYYSWITNFRIYGWDFGFPIVIFCVSILSVIGWLDISFIKKWLI